MTIAPPNPVMPRISATAIATAIAMVDAKESTVDRHGLAGDEN
jgi:hypothetical protein